VTELLNDYLKGLISEYADDVLDLETTRQVAEFIDKNEEAEAYFHRLQNLRRVTAECLRPMPDDPTMDLRMLHALRLRSFDRTWWEKLSETQFLSPRMAAAAVVAVLVLVMVLFGWVQAPVSRFLHQTKAKVEQIQDEARTDLNIRGQEITEGLGEMLAPPKKDDKADKTSTLLPKDKEVRTL
jgi:anti-sigma factor RsiW